MKRLIVAGTILVAGCTASQLSGPSGQLFCSIQTAGGGAFTAGIVAAALSNAAPAASPLFVVATNAGRTAVDADCAKAAASVAGAVSGVAVSPPANPSAAPQLAIVAPSSPVVSAK